MPKAALRPKVTERRKRIFRLAERLCDRIREVGAMPQPEDFVGWLQVNVPFTDKESLDDVEEASESIGKASPGPAQGAMSRLRQVLGLSNDFSIIAVLREASDRLEKKAEPVPDRPEIGESIARNYLHANLRDAMQFLSEEFPERTEEEITEVLRGIPDWESLDDMALLFAVQDTFTERERKEDHKWE